MLVDDAHGAGTLGETGKGTVEVEGVHDARIIRTVTLSKAFGTYGGAVLGTRKLCEKIRATSRVFAGSTPLPLPLANAALTALGVLQSDKSLRTRLTRNTQLVKTTLRAAGYALAETPSPIVSIMPRQRADISRLKKLLLARRIYPTFIFYPSGAESGYFRFAISSEHSRKQLDELVAALLEFVRSRQK
jgi:glycine C-acetyltransferase/8-amino-7-oxononanoate synthase